MTRNGKIARLPHGIREKLNRRLRDNVPGTKICEWVNRLPACKKVCAEFARRGGKGKSPVTVNQLSEWRRGGYQDWLQEQRALDESRELREWCGKLARNGGDLTEGAAALLGGQLLKLVQGMASFGKFQVPNSKFQSALANHDTGESLRGNIEHRTPNAEHRMSERAEPRAEGMESAVRLLGELVKCLSGIRRGDQNRVRLAQLDKKLALRSELVRMTTEKYEKEKAKEEKLERQKRAEEQRRKRSPVSQLSDEGNIDLLRGELFGGKHIIREREKVLEEREQETKRLRKELEILKAEMPSRRSSNGNATSQAPSVHPSSQSYDATRAPTTASADVGSQKELGHPTGCEPTRVDTSACDQLEGKNVGGNAGLSSNGGGHGSKSPQEGGKA